MITGRDGRVELHRGKVLKPQRLKNGYSEVYISLGTATNKKHRTVHSLVAQTFLGEKPIGHDVMHLNGDRSDNRVENLKYGSRSDNLRSTYAYGGRQANGKLSLEDVDAIRQRLSSGESPISIAQDFNVDSAAIYHIRNGTTFSWHKGGQKNARSA